MSDLAANNAVVAAAIGGNTAALQQLLLDLFPILERHIEPRIPPDARREISVDDVLQEVFVHAFRDIRRFQSQHDGSLIAWLKVIAEHRLADGVRRIGRKKRGGDNHRLSRSDFTATSTFGTLIDIVCHDSHLPDDSAIRREMEVAMQVALASLQDDQRDALCAHYLRESSVDEIAQHMGRTTGAVRGLIDRGKKNLAKAMGRSSRWLKSR